MMGMRYHRLGQRLTQAGLARRAHLSRARIVQMETKTPTGTYLHYENVSKILGVSVDELFKEIDSGEEDPYIEDAKMDPQEDFFNAISHFRIDRGLSYHALSKLLYCTSEAAKAACLTEESPEEHVEVLARALGLTTQGFLTIFREGDLM